jgi:GNAT superfamily N-acetyltransferase
MGETDALRIVVPCTDADISACHSVMAQLRPHVTEAEFLPRVRRQMQQGYELVALLADAGPIAVAGFRCAENFALGRYLYVDDLVTAADHRSRGCGEKLLAWLIGEAHRRDCDVLHLDSGVQRFEAHRFYLRQRMQISSHHFSMHLKQ